MSTMWSDANERAEQMKQEREAKKVEDARVEKAKEDAVNEVKQKEEDKEQGMI